MAGLIIKNVIYEGENYRFKSPDLTTGLNIIEGPNGTGKTTFIQLIYFALGGKVKRFDDNNEDFHKEIIEDKNNRVKLIIDIDLTEYTLIRDFSKNEVMVVYSDGEIEVFPITRRQNRIFSDWLLDKLNIKNFELYQGSYHGVINITDLMRLVYYDQTSKTDNIYKDIDNDSFVTNSTEFRKAIFEILIGGNYQEYYSLYSKFKKLEKNLSEERVALKQYKNFLSEVSEGREQKNSTALKKEIDELNKQKEKLLIHRERISSENVSKQDAQEQYDELKTELSTLRIEIDNNYEEMISLSNKKKTFLEAIGEFEQEIKKIKKIIHTNETIGLFEPDICPICLREVSRDADHCICGKEIKEDEYERFFYDTREYKELLKEKKRNILTLHESIDIINQDLTRYKTHYDALLETENNLKGDLKSFVDKIRNTDIVNEISKIDSNVFVINSQVSNLTNYYKFEQKRQKKEKDVDSAQKKYDKVKRSLDKALIEAQEDLELKVQEFNKIYEDLMVANVDLCRTVRLSTSYQPIINNGEAMPASINVHKRFLFFSTLLSLSLNHDIPFPRILLIDTPQNLGIDPEHLNELITSLYTILTTGKKTGQVIMTTGRGRYPDSLSELSLLKLSEENRLLKSSEPVEPDEKNGD